MDGSQRSNTERCSAPPAPGYFSLPRPTLAGNPSLLIQPPLILIAGGCSPASWLEASLSRLDLLVVVGGLLLLQAGLVVLALPRLLRSWERRAARERRIERLHEGLRHFRLWDDPAGVIRKVGIILDLNALQIVPHELEGTLLPGADLRGARLEGCQMRGVVLTGADLQGASLAGADLFGAELAGANLTFANLDGANLRGSNLEGARLNKAGLTGANLHRANLLDADLSRARLKDAVLDKARFGNGLPEPLRQGVHPSVEDWVRARLDHEGRYQPDAETPAPSSSLSSAM